MITIFIPKKRGFEPEYQAVLDFAIANSIATPDDSQNNINNLKVKYLKQESIWGNLSVFWNMKQPYGLDEFATLNWIDPSLYRLNQSNGSLFPVFDANNGYKGGNSVQRYFNTGYILNSDSNVSQGDISVFYKSFNVPSTFVSVSRFFGTRNSGNAESILFTDGSNTSNNYRVFTTSNTTTVQTDNNKHIAIARFAIGTAPDVYVDGVSTYVMGLAGAFINKPTFELVVLGINDAGTKTGNDNQTGLNYLAIGNSTAGVGKQNVFYEIMEGTYTP